MARNSIEEIKRQLNALDPTLGPTRYRLHKCGRENLARCWNVPTTKRKFEGNWTWQQVARFLERYNDASKPLNSAQLEAYGHLKAAGEHEQWSLDLLPKMFLDLDTLFFHSKLRHNVSLEWTIEPEEYSYAYTLPGPPRRNEKSRRIVIALNIPHMITCATVHNAIEVLVHEMCHAILLTLCPYDGDIAEEDRHLSGQAQYHGKAFQSIVRPIENRLGGRGYLHVSTSGQHGAGTIDRRNDEWERIGGFVVNGESWREFYN